MEERTLEKGQKQPKIKIYVSCHKECWVPDNGLLYPIQVGTALADREIPGFLHDNTGENISEENRKYCELTAQYWAWKNEDADYYGFMHYRRYFSFNPIRQPEDGWGEILFPYFGEKELDVLKLHETFMRPIIENADIIMPAARELRDGSVYSQYGVSDFQHRKDLDACIEIIETKYPQFHAAVSEYLNSNKAYECNMFIMKKQFFMAYSEWLFDVLKEVDKKIDYSLYSVESRRVLGFIGERLLGIWYTYIQKEQNCKTVELQKTLFRHIEEKYYPQYRENTIPVVIAANNNFCNYATVLLQSLMEHSSLEHQYDIYILNRDITEENINRIKTMAMKRGNFSVISMDVTAYLRGLDFFVSQHISIETYYRLIIFDVFSDFKKIIYLDSDMIVLTDIAELYQIDIQNYALAAVRDIDAAGANLKDKNARAYLTEQIGIENPPDYFQAGVLLLNIDYIKKNYDTRKLVPIAQSKNWNYWDQDVLNHVFKGHIYYLPQTWNVLVDWRDNGNSRGNTIKYAPAGLQAEYMEARRQPGIVHYAGFQKPWNVPDMDMADYFWKHARNTLIYESLMKEMLKQSCTPVHVENQTNSIPEGPMAVVRGIEDPIYLDGVMVKAIGRFNRKFPIGSKRRDWLRRLVKIFV